MQAHRILRHLQSGNPDTAGIDSLGWGNDDAFLFAQIFQGLIDRWHIGNFNIIFDTGLFDLFGMGKIDIILHRGRHQDIHIFDTPEFFILHKAAAKLFGVRFAMHRILLP